MDKHLIETTLSECKSIREASRRIGTSFTNLRYWISKHAIETQKWRLKHVSERKCPRCELVKPRSEFYQRRGVEGASAYCCPCANAQTVERQRAFKRMCVEYKGGRCLACGYSRCIGALEFHHRDPNEKDFILGGIKLMTLTPLIKLELDKCDMLCANCHREAHEKTAPHK